MQLGQNPSPIIDNFFTAICCFFVEVLKIKSPLMNSDKRIINDVVAWED